MSQAQEPDNPPAPSPTAPGPSPPRLTPSPDATDSEFKLSRKREREVSLEPVTTPTAGNVRFDPADFGLVNAALHKQLTPHSPFDRRQDSDPHRERKDSRTPLKKNRRRLEPTTEEEDGPTSGSGSGSGSPPAMDIVTSPRQEMKIKVRQISQGVEDISWKGFKKVTTPDQDVEVPVDTRTLSAAIELPEPEETKQAENNNAITTVDDDETPPKTPDDSVLSASVQDLKSTEVTMHPKLDSLEEPNRLRSASESGEKGLKRKFLERGTSQGPSENGEGAKHPSEPLKRARDESDKDDNPRDTKRPSPPPSPPRRTPPSPKVSKLGGFMAYASMSSPFSSVKGQNIFMSANKYMATPPFSPSPAPSLADLSSSGTPSSTPAPARRSGFEVFASTSSPFAAAAARAKSPVLGSTSKLGRAKSPPLRSGAALSSNPFASYAGPSQGFALPAQKRARPGSPDGSARSSLERTPSAPPALGQSANGSDSGAEDDQEDEPTTFGERLRAHKDDEDDNRSDEENGKVQLTEQDVMTGEEEEETLHQVRGKLFSLHGNQWKERGTGLLKLNVRVEDGTGARLVMRKDAVYTLLLNITLFPGMRCSLAQDPRYLRFSAIENGVATTYNLKVANAKIAADLLEEVNANIPS